MSDFKTRLSDEKAELSEKVEKLSLFIIGENFDKIDQAQQDLLNKQLPIMREYESVLAKRIALLS